MENTRGIRSLSAEALEGITSRLSGFEILSVWSCGDKTLNITLSKSGGAKVLRFTFPRFSDWYFPKLLILPSAVSEFDKLREITMKCPRGKVGEIFWLPRWPSVCSELQKFNFEFPNDGNWLVSALTSNPSRFPNLTTLKFRMTTLIAPLKQAQLVNFPNLTKLSVGGEAAVVHLTEIPNTLISLSLNIYGLLVEDGQFPPALVHFDLSCRFYPLFFSLLPDSLQSLKIANNDQVTIDDWQRLPLGLTSLSFFSNELRLHHFKALPMGLTSLDLPSDKITLGEELRVAMMDALPPLLKNLPCTLWDNIDASNIQHLPKSLEGSCGNFVDSSVVHLMPPKITSMRVFSASGCSIQGFPKFLDAVSIPNADAVVLSLLPRTVRFLRLCGRSTMLLSKHVPTLPPSLTYLHIYDCAGIENYEDIKLLPRGLKTLWLGTEDDYLCGREMPPESSSWFPEPLTFLSFGHADICDPKWFSTLPPNLTQLHLRVVQIPRTSFQQMRLPNLKELQIRDVQCVWDGASYKLLPKPKLRFNPHDMLSNLPPSLTSFKFSTYTPKVSKLTKQDLASLPKHLKSLDWWGPTKLGEGCLPTLPKSLSWLRLRPYKKTEKWIEPWKQSLKSKRRNIYKAQLNNVAQLLGIDPNEQF